MQLERPYGEFLYECDEHTVSWSTGRLGIIVSRSMLSDETTNYWLDIFREGEEYPICKTFSLAAVQSYLDYFFKYARA